MGEGGGTVKLQTINDVQVFMKGEQVIIPTTATDLLLQVLARAHDATGHPGVPQTVCNLSSIYIANKQRVVEDYIKSCPACQHAKAPGAPPPEGPMASILPTRPWGCIIFDYIGKLPDSSTGDNYILSCTDTITRMSYWLPCKAATSDTAVQVFNDLCFCTRARQPPPGRPLTTRGDVRLKPRLPLDLLTGSKREPHLSPEQWLQLLDATHESASISSALGAMRNKEGYDGKRIEPKRLNVGDTVLVWYPTRASKEVSNWQGPYKVTSPMDEHSFYAVAEMQAHGGPA